MKNFLKRRTVSIIIILAALAVIAIVIFKPFSPKGKSLETATVKRQDIVQTISASGSVLAVKQATLQFLTPGKLAYVGVKEGDTVRANQTIATLDSRDLVEKRKIALLDYSSIRWDFEQTKDDYKDIIPNDKIKRILEKSQFNLDRSVANVNLAQISLSYASLTTPISGIVTEIDAPLAGVVTTATNKFVIMDPTQMKFVANVDETDIGLIKKGQTARISLDAYTDESFEGVVDKISFSSVTTSGGGTAFPVEILLAENKDLKFKSGMNGDLEIIVKETKNVLTVPSRAIQEKEGNKYVRVFQDGNIREIEVKTGSESDTDIEITQGLSEGQIVVIK